MWSQINNKFQHRSASISRHYDENLFYRREYDAIHETQFHVCIPILRRVLLRKCLAEMRNNYAMDFGAM